MVPSSIQKDRFYSHFCVFYLCWSGETIIIVSATSCSEIKGSPLTFWTAHAWWCRAVRQKYPPTTFHDRGKLRSVWHYGANVASSLLRVRSIRYEDRSCYVLKLPWAGLLSSTSEQSKFHNKATSAYRSQCARSRIFNCTRHVHWSLEFYIR